MLSLNLPKAKIPYFWWGKEGVACCDYVRDLDELQIVDNIFFPLGEHECITDSLPWSSLEVTFCC